MNDTPAILSALRRQVESAPIAELEQIVAGLEGLKALAYVRMMAATVGDNHAADGDEVDDLLTADEVAKRLGVTPRWVQDHAEELPRVNMPGRVLRFSSHRLDGWIKRRSYA